MCGIFGGLGVADVPDRVFARMAERLAHRGPDGTALRRGREVALGLTRLAIVGVDEPAQVHTAGRVSAVMNGELYEHRALRRGLGVTGRSDAALVPALFLRDGPAFVDALEGPFAIALHDGSALHLIRDRLGKKPLYLRAAGRRVFFASEQKALAVTPGFSARVTAEVRDAFFRRGYLRDDEPLLAGVEAVAPGEWVTVLPDGRLLRRRWWTLEGRHRARRASVGGLLAQAVRVRLPDEVPYTLALSGGLDSTLVGAAAGARLAQAHCLEREGAGDAVRARRAARALGVPLEVVPLPPPSVDAFRRALFHLEQPDVGAAWRLGPALLHLGDTLRAQGVKVALLGEGADELFLGYAWDLLQASVERGGAHVPPDAVRLLGPRARYFRLNHSVARLYGPTPRARDVWLATAGVLALGEGVDAGLPAGLAGARRRQLVGLGHDLLTLPVLHADRLLMASGVEARLPFLDHRLVERALQLSPQELERSGTDKPVLRALARRWLPRWRPPPKSGLAAEALPPPEVLESLRLELSRGAPVAVDSAWFRREGRRAAGLALWRPVLLELAARAVSA